MIEKSNLTVIQESRRNLIVDTRAQINELEDRKTTGKALDCKSFN